MADDERARREPRLTDRGAATKARIVRAAADLMFTAGVNGTTLDDVRAASDTSKSQLYQHFSNKQELVHAVLAVRSAEVIARETQQLQRLGSLRGLQRWRDALVASNALRDGAYGCVLGSMASELADQDEAVRASLAATFAQWEGLLAAGLERMKAAGLLRPSATPQVLAIGLMAALQGGYLLAQTARDVTPMRIALDMAIDAVKSHAVA